MTDADKKLSSKWSVTLHDPSSRFPYTTLGEFESLYAFSQLFNSMMAQNLLHTLPTRVNITIYREDIRNKPNFMKQWHGEWSIELHHKTHPVHIYRKIILLIIGEQLDNKITSMVLQRIAVKDNLNKLNFKISIFTDMKHPKLDIKNILLTNNIIDLNHCVRQLVTFHPFKVINIHLDLDDGGNAPPSSTRSLCISDAANSNSNPNLQKVDNIAYVKYSMESLLEYSKRIANQTELLQHTAYSKFIETAFGHYADCYHLRLVNREDMKHGQLDKILATEGCVVCLQPTMRSPYAEDTQFAVVGGQRRVLRSKEREQKDIEFDDADEDGDGDFIIAQCADLKCQHVIHCECALNANDSMKIRSKHCTHFFKTINLSSLSNKAIQREIGYHINKEHTTDKRYHFSFRINHLISTQTSPSPQWPIRVRSYYQINEEHGYCEKQECLQIFFDNTELKNFQGTMQVAIIAHNGGMHADSKSGGTEHDDSNSPIFMHAINYEIPSPHLDRPTSERHLPCKYKLSNNNQIYQLRYKDQSPSNVLIVNVNVKLQPKPELQLLSLRYEFHNNHNNHNNDGNQSAIAACDEHSYCVQDAEAAATATTCVAAENISIQSHDENASDVSGATKYIDALPLATINTVPDESPLPPPMAAEAASCDPQHTTMMPSVSAPSVFSATPHLAATNVPYPITHIPVSMPMTMPMSMYVTPMSMLSVNNNTAAYYPSGSVLPHYEPPPAAAAAVTMATTPMATTPIATAPIATAACGTNTSSSSNGAVSRAETVQSNMTLNYNLYNEPLELFHYACTELGSNYISAKISNPVYFRIFFEKLSEFFPLLMVNGVGHSVCRAIYSQPHCTLSEKLLLLESLIPDFVSIVSNRQGSFAMICIMNLFAAGAEIQVLTKAFVTCISDPDKSKFDEIILSQAGYHVIKKYIAFGYPYFNCILHRISTDFTKYATHHYGVPIIRSILDMISMNERLVLEYQHCLLLFAQHTPSLVSNQYGNYVIQQLLDISPSLVSDTIKELMSSKYAEYSQHKFASNVVEKCLKHTLKEILQRTEQRRRQRQRQRQYLEMEAMREQKQEEMDDALQRMELTERERQRQREGEGEEEGKDSQDTESSDSNKENRQSVGNQAQSRRGRRTRMRKRSRKKSNSKHKYSRSEHTEKKKENHQQKKSKSQNKRHHDHDDDDADVDEVMMGGLRCNWVRPTVQELLADAATLINHKYGNYCLQTALSVLIELSQETEAAECRDSVLLLQEFVNTIYPLLHLLRSNVKKKWQQLLLSSIKVMDAHIHDSGD